LVLWFLIEVVFAFCFLLEVVFVVCFLLEVVVAPLGQLPTVAVLKIVSTFCLIFNLEMECSKPCRQVLGGGILKAMQVAWRK